MKFLSSLLLLALVLTASAAAPPVLYRPAVNVLRVASNVADGETVTVGSVVFEVDTAANPGSVTAGRIRVNCSAAVTPAEFTTQFAAAVNAGTSLALQCYAVRVSASEVLLVSYAKGLDTRACSDTLAGTNNAFAGATFYGGSTTQEDARQVAVLSRAANATEAALETMHFVAPFAPTSVVLSVRTAAGVAKAFDGAVTVTGSRIDVASSGTTDVAATDVVTVVVSN